jgi:hypothetical protein
MYQPDIVVVADEGVRLYEGPRTRKSGRPDSPGRGVVANSQRCAANMSYRTSSLERKQI